MRIDLLPQKKAFKANLHSHSTLSDGKLTPEELVKFYKEHGYSVLAITDHEFTVDHSAMNTDDFLLLTGYELQIVDNSVAVRKSDQRVCHLCLISKDPHNFKHVYFNPEAPDLLRLCKRHDLIPSLKTVGRSPKVKEYSKEVIEEVVKTATANGMLVAFNHPTWSLEADYDSYKHLDGIYAMEIYNHDCGNAIGLEEYNPSVYDRMLRENMRTGCIATDDTHYGMPYGDPKCDLFGGWTQIMADDLSYDTIIHALEKGDFYASTGPEIKEIWFDGRDIRVSSSEAERIIFSTAGRHGNACVAKEGQSITEAAFTPGPEDRFVRITIRDHQGHTANSRGYFTDEFM